MVAHELGASVRRGPACPQCGGIAQASRPEWHREVEGGSTLSELDVHLLALDTAPEPSGLGTDTCSLPGSGLHARTELHHLPSWSLDHRQVVTGLLL